MKKNSILLAAIILSATLFSCKKEKLQTRIVVNNSTLGPVQERIVSDWLSLPLNSAVYSNASSLRGGYSLSSAVSYDYNDHVQLVFARSRGREEFVYEKLPINIGTSQGNVRIDFSLTYSNFAVNIWNTDSPAQSPVIQQFSNMQYRFIVIPKSIYQSLNINWNEYTEVATALNL
jgi:hypothetical protein